MLFKPFNSFNCHFYSLSSLLKSHLNKKIVNNCSFSSYIPYFSANFDVKNGCCLKNPYLKSSISEKYSQNIKNVDNIKDLMSNTERKCPLDSAKNPLIYIEFSIKKSNSERYARLIPFFYENWLLKYIIYIRNIPKNRLVK